MSQPRPLDSPLTLEQILRFWRTVSKRGHGGCWVWQGKLDQHNNAHFCVQRRTVSARRVAWDLEHPDGEPLNTKLYVRPKCDTIGCVRPEHMEIVINGGSSPRETCGRGHKFTPENTYYTTQGKRACRACIRLTGQARRKRYLEEGRGWGRTYEPAA